MDEFNFDEWANLYKNHPEEFERNRTKVLDDLIQNAPVHCRNDLRLLQMECDVYHNTMTPLAGTVAMTKLMAENMNKMKSAYTELDSAIKDMQQQIDKLDD